MRNLLNAVIVLMVAGTTICVQAQKKNVILFIGDGFGIAPKTAARMALGQGRDGKRFSTDAGFQLMQLDALKYNGTITTHSLNSWVTDSAPGAACYASGQAGKIDNEFISLDPQTMQSIPTILEAAKKQGYAVGLVTTTRITHATPAVFATHIWHRDLEDYIAAQYISKSEAEYEAIFNGSDSTYNAGRDWVLPTPKVGVEVDVLLGGGSRQFLPRTANGGANIIVRDRNGNALIGPGGPTDTIRLGNGRRIDNANLVEIAKTRGFQYINSRDALLGLDLTQFTSGNNKKLLGLFRDSHMDYEQDRQMTYPWQPNLAEMTEIAIEVLKRKSDKGFFLVVESGRIDHLEHANCGGIGFTFSPNRYVVTADKPAVKEDLVYNGDTTKIVPGVYGSDYMIKEVLAYDYAVGKGRILLNDNSMQTLVMATSDHECGGFAVVGLHDSANAQSNGTLIRTYAKSPSKPVFTPTPVSVTRNEASWFPAYEMYDFQGYQWPRPVSPEARRIVVAYGSNPITNGNGNTIGGTPGNHTPQDILTYADDNINGLFASRINGKGLRDNTDLEPIMESFLGVSASGSASPIGGGGSGLMLFSHGTDVTPNPAHMGNAISFQADVTKQGNITVAIYNSLGQLVRRMLSETRQPGVYRMQWNTLDDNGVYVPADTYTIVITADGEKMSQQSVVIN